jgi:predicted RNA-binding Zn ribbon-like protein
MLGRLCETINRLIRAALAGEAPNADDLREINDWARRELLAPQADRRLRRRWTAERPVQAALPLLHGKRSSC